MSTTSLIEQPIPAETIPAAVKASASLGVIGRCLLRLAETETPASDIDDEQSPVVDSQRVHPSALQNRRALPRRQGMCSARVGICPDGIPVGGPERDWLLSNSSLRGDLHDVSLNAVAFDLITKLPVGERVLLRLENHEQGVSVEAIGNVVRTADTEDGFYRIVCSVQPQMQLDEVSQLGWMPFASELI